MLSYKSILAKPPPSITPVEKPIPESEPTPTPTPVSNTNAKSKTHVNTNHNSNTNHISNSNPLKQRIIKPRYKSPYTKKETIKWLYHKIDNGIFNYDYCARLYELLKKWIRINRFSINVGDDVLFGRFVSLMYLMSSKSE
jgi:hypothetical protein